MRKCIARPDLNNVHLIEYQLLHVLGIGEVFYPIYAPTVKVIHRSYVIVDNPAHKAALYAIHRLHKVTGHP